MAKRKRLSPALLGGNAPNEALTGVSEPVSQSAGTARPPIAHVAGEAAEAAAFAEVAGALADARAEGRLIQKLPLDAIETGHLVRDRVAFDVLEMKALRESLAARGQQVPIEVVTLPPDPAATAEAAPRYGLISGLRRVMALREIEAETVLALVRAPQSSAEAYLAMVEENEIRAQISLYERGRLAYEASELGLYRDGFEATKALFGTASRAKRSKIGSFMTVHAKLGDLLTFPAAIPERLGLRIAQALEKPEMRLRLREALASHACPTPEAERALLEDVLDPPRPPRKKRAEPPVQSLPQGVRATPGKARLALSGKALTPELQAELLAWLEARLSQS
jgi:ParB family chromosome partitioning protein